MKRTLQVLLGDELRLVGTLHHDQNGAREHAAFLYAPEWLAAPDRFPLEPGLPLVGGPQFHRKAGSQKKERCFRVHLRARACS